MPDRQGLLTPQNLHDLRTPLNQIIGYSELLVEQAEAEGQSGYLSDLNRIVLASRELLTRLNGPSNSGPDVAEMPVTVPPASPKLPDSLAVVLVVDDILSNRELLLRRLERLGHRVEFAANGLEALRALGADRYDLVLLDIMMPEMDGFEVLAKMKADATLDHIPVIMITALNEEESVVRCIELGAEDYLVKPFNPTLLKARIGACLAKKRAYDREARLTEQLQQQLKRLQELERLRDDLTHMLVHDLRTPLTSMIGGLQSVDGMGDLNGDQREMIGIAAEGAETLLGMVNDLLDVSQMEAGAMQLEYGEVDACELVAEACTQVASLLKNKGLSVSRDIEAGMAPFCGDKSKLRRILVNLLGNAIKFTPGSGLATIAVHVRSENGAIFFSVIDSGEGIPREDLDRIFEKFGQVESRKGGRSMSTGLGLTFCKLAALAHGGDIGVESTPGHGSTFFINIPLQAPSQTG